MSAAGRSAELEAAIGRTRGELGRTLDALERKLAARRLFEEGVRMVTHSIAAEGGLRARLVEAARANPAPFALIGAGLLWLLADNTGLFERVARDERVQGAVRQIVDVAGTIGGAGADRDGWVHRAAGAARGAVGAVRETGNVAIEHAGGYAGYASERATRAAERAAQLCKDNALLFGAVGFVVGVVTAALLPPTRLATE